MSQGQEFICAEFHGKGDRMFGGGADDRILGKSGTFLTGAGWTRRDYARFASKEAALAAGELASNKRKGSLLSALPWVP